MMEPLPIDPLLPCVVSGLRAAPALLITAPPGAGKTTRVPRALHDAGFAERGEIVILEPRRLATRLAAARVAAEFGEKPGKTVGYSVRFETVGGSGTRIRFVTEGILSRRIVQDPMLSGVAAVILDEFHERHLATDLALAYLRQLQESHRPDLRLIVMSATLDVGALAVFLGDCTVLSSEGTRFETRVEYEEKATDCPLEEKVTAATRKLLREGLDGDILVFLPGAAEIRKAGEMLAALALRENLAVIPLHGDLPADAQAAAVEPATKRKIILATNVAETSITIPGVVAVIDSGLARTVSHSVWTGLPVLHVVKISKAAATQRSGRAGRTSNGRVLRLYTRADFDARPDHDIPEIKRADLAEPVLTLHGAGIEDVRRFPWFESPSGAALEAAEELLSKLGAFDTGGKLTETGRRMLRFPAHPRLARLIVEGENLGVASDALLLAALLSERDIRIESRSNLEGGPRRRLTRRAADSDLLELRDSFEEAEKMHFTPGRVRSLDLDPAAVDRVRRSRDQLARLTGRDRSRSPLRSDADEALRIAILAAFPDRVAKRRAPASHQLLLSAGGSGRLSEESVVHNAILMAAVDATERRGETPPLPGTSVLVRLASAIESEWLAALFPGEIQERVELVWNDEGGRVDELRRTFYGQLTLEETVRPAQPSERTASLLADAAYSRNLSCFPDWEEIATLQMRLELLNRCYPELGLPLLDASQIRSAVMEVCSRKKSLAELGRISLCDQVITRLSARQRDWLRRETPERVALGPKRTVKVHYENGKPPWIESRLQDFFQLKATPAVCGGRLPLTVHLLAPNGRAVQVTQDLAGFWQRHYPSIRRQLQRRYPKHAWPAPEDL